MALKLKAFTCPTCGSNEVVRVGTKTFKCSHCQNTHNLVDEKEPVRVIRNHNVNVDTGVLCSACGFVNEKSAHSCGNCNSPLYARCPSCFASNHAFRRYCHECGEDMVATRAKKAKAEKENEPLRKIEEDAEEAHYEDMKPRFDAFMQEYAEWVGHAKVAIYQGTPQQVEGVIAAGADLQRRFFEFVGRADEVLFRVLRKGAPPINYVVEWKGVYKYHDSAASYLQGVGTHLGYNLVNVDNVMHTLLVKLLTKRQALAAKGTGALASVAVAATLLVGAFAAIVALI